MARAGITETQVFEAAETLLQDGLSVTVSAVRERIGSGSYSTINTHLGKWREANDHRKPSDVPEIPPSVENALRHVWALAWKEAQERIKTERDGLDAARREMDRERKVMEAEIADLETRLNDKTDEIKSIGEASSEKSKALEEAKTAQQALSVENARLAERSKAADQRTEELRRELDKLHERLRELASAKPETTARSARKKVKPSERK